MANDGLDSLWHVDDDLHQTNLVVDQAKQLDYTGSRSFEHIGFTFVNTCIQFKISISIHNVLQYTIIVGNN